MSERRSAGWQAIRLLREQLTDDELAELLRLESERRANKRAMDAERARQLADALAAMPPGTIPALGLYRRYGPPRPAPPPPPLELIEAVARQAVADTIVPLAAGLAGLADRLIAEGADPDVVERVFAEVVSRRARP
jgi:hypothetical protein